MLCNNLHMNEFTGNVNMERDCQRGRKMSNSDRWITAEVVKTSWSPKRKGDARRGWAKRKEQEQHSPSCAQLCLSPCVTRSACCFSALMPINNRTTITWFCGWLLVTVTLWFLLLPMKHNIKIGTPVELLMTEANFETQTITALRYF